MLCQTEKSYGLNKIASTVANKGNIDRAVDISNGISIEADKVGALSHIANCCAKKGNNDRAIEIAKNITDENIRDSTIVSILSQELDHI